MSEEEAIDMLNDGLCDNEEVVRRIYGDIANSGCENCVHGIEYDGNIYQCEPLYYEIGGIETFTLPMFCCNNYIRKDIE